MRNTKYNKPQVVKYLVWTFALAYIMQAGVGLLYKNGRTAAGQMVMLPSICHGAINAAATVPLAVCISGTGSARLLGPSPNGIIAVLPFLAVSVILLLLRKKERSTAYQQS